MGFRPWMAGAVLALGMLGTEAYGQQYLGWSAMPNGYDWAAYTAAPCSAPAYGTYGSVVPGTYDCPSCAMHVWGGYAQKKALHYERKVAANCPTCSGETPCPPRCATPVAGCGPRLSGGPSVSGCARLPEQGCATAPLPPGSEMMPSPPAAPEAAPALAPPPPAPLPPQQ